MDIPKHHGFDQVIDFTENAFSRQTGSRQRQRLALRASTVCAALARLREDERAPRDAEHLISGAGADAHTSPVGRVGGMAKTRPAGNHHINWNAKLSPYRSNSLAFDFASRRRPPRRWQISAERCRGRDQQG